MIVSSEISISGEVLFSKITHRSSLEGEVKEMIFIILNSPKLVMSIFILCLSLGCGRMEVATAGGLKGKERNSRDLKRGISWTCPLNSLPHLALCCRYSWVS